MKLLSGNEAIARGAYEAGVKVALAYPGTPSTEILENIIRHYPEIYAEWAANEKVAVEVGIGACLAGARTLVAMKHVGVNVAADPLLTLTYTGVNAGFVLVSADDPGMHSSQNEQDNRFYARFAQVPLLEPADSQEAKDFVKAAFEISEAFDTPVLLRTTTRVSHSKSLVQEGEPVTPPPRKYRKDFAKYAVLPAHARVLHEKVERRREELRAYAESSPLNRIEWGDRRIGFITSGIAYQYVKELFPWASVLKLGLSYPLPLKLVRQFAREVQRVIVVEELEPFLEEQILAAGIRVQGKDLVPRTGELSPARLAWGLSRDEDLARLAEEYGTVFNFPPDEEKLPVRPPVLCPGCPHRGVFYVLKKMKLVVTGDIGCYTLGGLPPLGAMDTCICMGASIGMAHGLVKADPELSGRTVAVIGDSTFFHTGLPALANLVYNRGAAAVIVLDNRTTAMTGHQDHPGTGRTARGEETVALDAAEVARALGAEYVEVVDPYDLQAVRRAVEQALRSSSPAVVVARRPCVLLTRPSPRPLPYREEVCRGCGLCLELGCPALALKDRKERKIAVDPLLCVGCGLCAQVCPFGALEV
ncbi:indolepyruvate ferredoxin oxidoreductase subunit alpha [Ammonifex thiophilus]|uniref:Indolepyruvate oxidoreductase subunit IorA n=1 Tax=Ammonifex thiophilus TaxID=444093 RepID=A0A3D8P701_9THEO|nr:indolepyruvate ferredoxin oxidoreductase subunit alpha [Ammonifex thiophilus]RDV84328.1 indolepyruvate ferredoxin oxidoreductase subunit alpha [Ammonifex thiophilus]